MSRQACPQCEKHWTPPGPCTNWDGGEECGYREPDRTVRAAVPKPASASMPAPAESYVLADPLEGLRQAREELNKAKQTKGAA